MGDTKKVAFLINSDDEEQQFARYKKKDETTPTPDFWEEIEKNKKDGTIDPGMYAFYKSLKPAAAPACHDAQAETPATSVVPCAADTCHEILLFRGPRAVFLIGEKIFDELCMFGNDMYLTKAQQEWLVNWCNKAKADRFQRKFYIHRMTNSNVIEGKSKMDIGANFSKTYLHAQVEQERMVPVQSNVSTKSFCMKVKKGQGKNTVMMIKDWAKAMIEYKIKENDIWLFNFSAKHRGELEVLMVPLPKC